MARFINVRTEDKQVHTVNIEQISSINDHGQYSRLVLKEIEHGQNVELITLENPFKIRQLIGFAPNTPE